MLVEQNELDNLLEALTEVKNLAVGGTNEYRVGMSGAGTSVAKSSIFRDSDGTPFDEWYKADYD